MSSEKIFLASLIFIALALQAQAAFRMSPQDFSNICGKASIGEIRSAMRSGADWNTYALISAARSNPDPNVITLLVEEGGLSAADTTYGNKALCEAAAYNNPEVVQRLIDLGANVNARLEYTKMTPLLCAAERTKYAGVIYVLLKAGADVKAWEAYGKTAARLALNNSALRDTVALERLLENNRLTDSEFTLLCRYASPGIIKAALRGGVDLKSDGLRNILIDTAYYNKHPEIVQIFTDGGVDVNYPQSDGRTALTLTSNPEMIKALLKAGADVNKGEAIFHAARYSGSDVLNILLDAGANANVLDRNNNRPIDYARKNNSLANTDALKRLESLTTMPTNREFIELCAKGSAEKIREAIKNGADVNAELTEANGADRDTYLTALMVAAGFNSDLEAVKILIEAGADVNVERRGPNRLTLTVLSMAAVNKNPKVMDALLDLNLNKGIDFALEIAKDNPKFKGSQTLKRLHAIANKSFVPNAIIAGDKVNIRQKPNSQAKVIFQLNTGHPVKVLRSDRGWTLIRTSGGKDGWVYSDYVKTKNK
ncbi:MAG: ankyrin repeat domain-containing protein [Synergistaceae bacterium]|nr:ankyrin repeat domain-containing protein [Synergistaceae bacterium]MBR0097814.1 ankyrin repeat domain-containing protein [Synergistaceae bacterium]